MVFRIFLITKNTDSTNRSGWPLIFAMISYDKKMKNQIGYRVSLHDEYDEGWLSDLPLGIRSWPKPARKFYSNFFVVFLDMKLAFPLWPRNGGGVSNTYHGLSKVTMTIFSQSF